MVNAKLTIGSRVRWVRKNLLGTIIADPEDSILVEFDKELAAGHDGGQGQGKPGHCWWIRREELMLISTPKKKLIIQSQTFKDT